MIRIPTLTLLAFVLWGCQPTENEADAYGNFEADETLISAEANGRLLEFQLEEGQTIKQGQYIGQVDTVQLYLQKVQLEASLQSLNEKLQNAEPDILVLQKQLDKLNIERKRLDRLVANNAAPFQQLDDINGQITVVEQQMTAARDKVSLANRSILSEADPIRAQINILQDQLDRCRIYSPISGSVLLKLAQSGEMVSVGKPLFKVANLDPIFLRVYISGRQLQSVKLGQEVSVQVDDGEGMRALSGTVSWISDQAEFTPKTIQTREERVSLVYALKVKVPNDGRLKIGMPAEIKLPATETASNSN